MRGTMLWFNLDKGYGFIQAEDEERLYVTSADFQSGEQPGPRCKGQAVSFERQVAGEEIRAVNVSFVAQTDPPRRARLRHARGGRGV
jgi:cold shock CspA family protein